MQKYSNLFVVWTLILSACGTVEPDDSQKDEPAPTSEGGSSARTTIYTSGGSMPVTQRTSSVQAPQQRAPLASGGFPATSSSIASSGKGSSHATLDASIAGSNSTLSSGGEASKLTPSSGGSQPATAGTVIQIVISNGSNQDMGSRATSGGAGNGYIALGNNTNGYNTSVSVNPGSGSANGGSTGIVDSTRPVLVTGNAAGGASGTQFASLTEGPSFGTPDYFPCQTNTNCAQLGSGYFCSRANAPASYEAAGLGYCMR